MAQKRNFNFEIDETLVVIPISKQYGVLRTKYILYVQSASNELWLLWDEKCLFILLHKKKYF